MPNHVYNTIEFTGKNRDLVMIMKKVSMPRPGCSENRNEFNFHYLVTPSDTEWYKDSNNWYNWNIANWGTKWNAYDVEIDDKIDDDHPFLGYSFTTAWSPPTNVILALVDYIVEKRLDISMDWFYEEEQGWGGKMHYDIITGYSCVEEWDIPNSHEELVERRGECCCSGEFQPFEDCPKDEE